MQKTIFIVSGGTGGHIIPARSFAKFCSKNNFKTYFFGDLKINNYIKENDNFKSYIVSASQFNKDPYGLIKFSLTTLFGIIKSLYFILIKRPNYVIGFGGYATFPMLIASIITKRKIILHEQNAHLGKVNRFFLKYAKKLATTFLNTDGINIKYRDKVNFTGNPVREEILKLHTKPYLIPNFNHEFSSNKFGYDVILNSEFYQDNSHDQLFKILIIGGSGGAKIFSDILPKAFFNLPEHIKENIQITQQCRQELLQTTFEEYKKLNLNIIVDSFFEDMAQLIEDSHLVIARAGSSSISEFCCAKKPMILIPFSKSADNHQLKNANFLFINNSAILIKEEEFTIQKINEIFLKLFNDNKILYELSKNAEKIAIIDANEKLFSILN